MKNKLLVYLSLIILPLSGCVAIKSAARPAATIVASSVIKKDKSNINILTHIADGIESLSKTLTKQATIEDFQKLVIGFTYSQEISILVNHIYSIYKEKIILSNSIEESRLVLMDIANGIRDGININSPSK